MSDVKYRIKVSYRFDDTVKEIFKHVFFSLQTQGRFFLDKLTVNVIAGNGGNGLPKYGGIGGAGGNVYLVANKSTENLRSLLKKFPDRKVKASSGDDSRRYRILGMPGKDIRVPCPIGVAIVNDLGATLGDLNDDNDEILVALGGKGGCSANNYFGQRGQRQCVTIDLKLLADVGLIGFPNAGKSTFLKAVSRASPKIANFPFTTLTPNIGMVEFKDYRQISVADLPGLIEGAHKNLGLGYRFLKHITRTKLLAFIVDINGFQLAPDMPFRSPLETINLLTKEIELYDDSLLSKPAVLLISKMDSTKSAERYSKFLDQLRSMKEGVEQSGLDPTILPTKQISFLDVIPICSHTGDNIVPTRERFRKIIDYCYELERKSLGLSNSFLSTTSENSTLRNAL